MLSRHVFERNKVCLTTTIKVGVQGNARSRFIQVEDSVGDVQPSYVPLSALTSDCW